MTQIKVSSFVKLVPEAARAELPAEYRDFKVALMPWLSQVYYSDKLIHYELVKLPSRYSDSRLELGLHFESRNHALNSQLLAGFDRYLYEIREKLGENWVAEQWDRGWTKVYTTIDFTVIDEDLVAETAHQLSQTITVLQPMFELIQSSMKKRSI
jgi:hypothetical protein